MRYLDFFAGIITMLCGHCHPEVLNAIVEQSWDFESEVKLISNVHHRNLIRFLRCCSKELELLFIYEYMAMIDEPLYPIAVLINKLKNEDIQLISGHPLSFSHLFETMTASFCQKTDSG